MSIEGEWLEADGLGGYASGATSTLRTRRYHALLQAATTPPTGRMVLVNGIEAWVETPGSRYPLTSQRYAPGITFPEVTNRIIGFTDNPWPRWTYDIGELILEYELFVPAGAPMVVLAWRPRSSLPGATLHVRPLLSGRRDHALHHENPAFRFDGDEKGQGVTWAPYDGVPATTALSNGIFSAEPDWYRHFLYDDERTRGLDDTEDLASPGVFQFALDDSEAFLVFVADTDPQVRIPSGLMENWVYDLRIAERQRRGRFKSRLERAADGYVVQRGAGQTIIAGYPWFTDWGRDTFISLRGICGSPDRTDTAAKIILAWCDTVSQGMVPNRFPDVGDEPEYNSVDASLWFVIAAFELIARASLGAPATTRIREAIEAILTGYSQGTRFGIRRDSDGLLACGEDGSSLTWMDARVDGRAITPRIGKPVEIQALWINALRAAADFSPAWASYAAEAQGAFEERFWNPTAGCLHDVVDVNHVAGTVDSSFRPNQIFAVGGLPRQLISGTKAQSIVDCVERTLLTPAGLRSLAPGEPGYCPRYEGGPRERDNAYHQGTVWPWLMGPFVEAWLRVRPDSQENRAEARRRFLEPLLDMSTGRSAAHIPEIADAEPPHISRGCPFQAWSVGEALRIERLCR